MNNLAAIYEEMRETPEHFRILRKITPYTFQQWIIDNLEGYDNQHKDIVRLAVLDFETTGFKAGTDKPIELGIILFDYSPSQKKLRQGPVFRQVEDPGFPLPDIIQTITGLNDELLEGQRFNDAEVVELLKDVDVMVAHNAKFDRAFFDLRFPELANLKWACSQSDIDWYGMGYESGKLEYLVFKHGYFYDGHNALNDCYAVGRLFLSNPDALNIMLKTASESSFLIEAYGLPFAQKDAAKDMNFKWNPTKKVWHITVKGTEVDIVSRWLAELPGSMPHRNTVTEIKPEARHK